MLPSATSNPARRSVFCEVGLLGDDALVPLSPPAAPPRRPRLSVRFRSTEEILGAEKDVVDEAIEESIGESKESDDVVAWPVQEEEQLQSPTMSKLHRLSALVLFLALLVPFSQCLPFFTSTTPLFGVKAALIPRADSPTDVCTRWSHATALVNGTLYIYGGRATTDSDQTSNTWNNDFLTLDLTSSWQISSPSFKGLPQPSGPPAVSLAYLWNSRSSLYLYGGEFQDGTNGNTPDEPTAFSLWEYDISSSSWREHSDPKTSAGDNSESAGQAVQRAAEGAGVDVPQLGRGFYFGGHLDTWTTEGWSNQISRIYIKSLVEYTFPDYANPSVKDLSDGSAAGSDGVWRNVTEGGSQETNGFPERADGILVYVPGFGDEGILLGLAGGTNSKFTQMNVIDVYDIANSTWYKQPTSGTQPKIRVNPCAVVAAAADGSSYNMYMFGGQDLGNDQTQYNDMWILTIPSFTWVEVDMSDQSVPYERAGHTCNIWDGQMIVVGGYVGTDLSCDSPGVYVFNTSSLTWGTQFTSLSGKQSASDSDSGSDSSSEFSGSYNPFSQQSEQRGSNASSGLEGSYGYTVPDKVVSIIGGSPAGGATVTAPVQTPTAGPLATGKPLTYTLSSSTTQTAAPGLNNGNRSHDGTNIGAIVAGVVAGVAALVAAYFGFCAWVYRRQLLLYKNHAAMAQAQANGTQQEKQQHGNDSLFPAAAGVGAANSAKNSWERQRRLSAARNASNSGSTSGGATGGVSSHSGGGADAAGRSRAGSVGSSTDDLLRDQEPSFWGTRGVLLNPRRSLRVINRD
ncbi:uncharacterized protein K452DRAFT_217510 [Aplosporella prunicola CBS 121167]|uniref:Uncharacterized protein n=1 Tax=Aplosporella prunicola CBS 121167 TaxID=1176127 RepID=A0A6A6BTM1_9PEZI|nr:uncharacterized protein K452DRAFT_217510 [Aplosporella prunicola CBS 121167]KAF2147462.1 hypothetical protein K452DRAFT_217510 [Aplosporella prunicola CBS 121167]